MYLATGNDELWKIGGLEFLRLLKAYLTKATLDSKEELEDVLQNKVPGQEFDAWLDGQA